MTDRESVPSPLPAFPRAPVVSVVMPVRDAASTLATSVRAVLEQRPPVDEVVLAIGPSMDDTLSVARRLTEADPRVSLVHNPSGRTPDALNRAVAAARGDVLVRVDAQAVLPEGYVVTAVEALRRTGAANVGGVQVPSAARGFARCVAAAMRSPFGAGGAAYRGSGRAGPVDTVYLGVFRREALEAVEGFDPRFVRNQDAELNERLRRAGYVVWFEPTLRVAYTPRATIRALARQYWQYGRWRRLTARVHRGSLRARQLAAPALVLSFMFALLAGAVFGTVVPVAGLALVYGLGLIVAALHAADGVADVIPTALALGTMHVSWGVGFLAGPPRTGGPSPSTMPDRRG